MSLIHWDKSVFAFHLQEILEDHHKGDPSALVGLGAIIVGSVVLKNVIKQGKPILKTIIKSSLSMYSPPKEIINATLQHPESKLLSSRMTNFFNS
jgi:hypothetical protein